jgi:hypothetical protein
MNRIKQLTEFGILSKKIMKTLLFFDNRYRQAVGAGSGARAKSFRKPESELKQIVWAPQHRVISCANQYKLSFGRMG